MSLIPPSAGRRAFAPGGPAWRSGTAGTSESWGALDSGASHAATRGPPLQAQHHHLLHEAQVDPYALEAWSQGRPQRGGSAPGGESGVWGVGLNGATVYIVQVLDSAVCSSIFESLWVPVINGFWISCAGHPLPPIYTKQTLFVVVAIIQHITSLFTWLCCVVFFLPLWVGHSLSNLNLFTF